MPELVIICQSCSTSISWLIQTDMGRETMIKDLYDIAIDIYTRVYKRIFHAEAFVYNGDIPAALDKIYKIQQRRLKKFKRYALAIILIIALSLAYKLIRYSPNSYIPPPINTSHMAFQRPYKWSKVEHSGEFILQILLDQLQLYRQIDICVIGPYQKMRRNVKFAPYKYIPLCIFQGFCQQPRKWHILPTLSIDFHRKILTDSGYIMLDSLYVLNHSIQICRHFQNISGIFIAWS